MSNYKNICKFPLFFLVSVSCISLYSNKVFGDSQISMFSPENVSRLTAEQYFCPLYQVDAYSYTDGSKRLADPIMIRGNFQLQCLEDEFNRAYNFCYDRVLNGPMGSLEIGDPRRMNMLDDCIVEGFFLKKADYGSVKTNWNYIDSSTWSLDGILSNLFSFEKRFGTFYLRTSDNGQTCESVTDPKVIEESEICDLAELRFIATPISLLLCDGCSLEEDAGLTQFPVDLVQKGSWFTWLASDKAPLLVYDPEHRGVVKDATQLFGTWTFGGRAVASIMNTSRLGDLRWNNGYEPLALMDKDNDGKISGEELEPLALWFDFNRNGISELGEVRRLAENQITAVYYHPNDKQLVSGAIYAERGYSQVIDGKEVIRSSVDWFSESDKSATDLAARYLTGITYCSNQSFLELQPKDSTPEELPLARNAKIDEINGAWRWKITGGDSPATEKDAGGFFTFSVKDKKLVGHSLFELKLKKPIATATTFVQIIQLNGDVLEDPIHGNVLHFTTAGDEHGAKSKMFLEDGGTVLNGETKTIANRNGKQVSLSFTWRATKLKPKQL